jgi:chemotaxis protein MotB
MTMDTLYEQIKEYIESQGMDADVSISKHEDIIYIRFSSQILFEPDRYQLVENSLPLLSFVGEVLKLYEEKIRVINICGHTAQTGRVSSTVNDWRLSGERAATVAIFFQDGWHIDKKKMITFGYGDNYPIADNATEPGRQQNRRVELVIVGEESLANFDVYGILGGIFDEEQFPTSGGANEILAPGGGGDTN